MTTIADGIAIKSPSPLTLAHAQAYVDDVVTVDDDEIGRALVLLLERAKAVVEPAGAVGLAALLAGDIPGDGPVMVVLSGGNVDPLLLVKLIDHGLSASGRFLRISARVPTTPAPWPSSPRSSPTRTSTSSTWSTTGKAWRRRGRGGGRLHPRDPRPGARRARASRPWSCGG